MEIHDSQPTESRWHNMMMNVDNAFLYKGNYADITLEELQ